MTNGEYYKTAQERGVAYYDYCSERLREGGIVEGKFEWLEMKFKEELKPCPFCGGEAEIVDLADPDFKYYQIKCSKCACKTEAQMGLHNAVEVWNMRAK